MSWKSPVRLGCAACVLILLAGCDLLGLGDEERLEGERIRIRDRDTASEQISGEPIPAQVRNDAWTQTNGRASHASGHLEAASTLTPVWRADAGEGGDGGITSAPVIVGGRVFALDAAAQVSAFDADDGSVAWRTSVAPEGEDGADGFGGGLAAEGDTLFAATGFGEIVALSAASGEIRWRYHAGVPFRAAPAVASGTVIAVTRDNRAIAVSGDAGEPVWRLDGAESAAGSLGGASPAIAGQLAVLPFASGEVIGVHLGSGRSIWSAVLGGARRGLARASIPDVTGDPVIVGRVVVAANQSGRIVAIDGQTGRRGWTRAIGSTGPIWAAGDSIYMTGDDASLTRLSINGGQTIWRVDLPAYEDPEDREDPIAYSGPVLAGGQLLVTDSLGNLLSFDPATGDRTGGTDLAAGATAGVAVASGMVYVLSEDGTLHAYR